MSSTVLTYPSCFSIQEVTVNKDKMNSKVGLSLKKAARESGIALSGLTENSPLRGTAIRSKGGQVLLAVNGDPNLPDVATAANLLGSRQRISLLVCEQHEHFNTTASCIQIVAAPFFRHNPGVCFGSTRGRTLVTISKIFKSGPYADNHYLHKGDIVLAVNGIPVSKPEEADRALRFPAGGNDGSVTVLHVVDINYFRALVRGAVDAKIPFKQDKHDPEKHIMVAQRAGGSTTSLPIRYDPETQHMIDPSPYKKLVAQSDSGIWDFKNPKVFFKNWYQRVITFMDNFNARIDAALDPLEDLACEHAWRHQHNNPQSSSPPMIESPTSGRRASISASTPGFVRPTILLEDTDVHVPLTPKSPRGGPHPDIISC